MRLIGTWNGENFPRSFHNMFASTINIGNFLKKHWIEKTKKHYEGCIKTIAIQRRSPFPFVDFLNNEDALHQLIRREKLTSLKTFYAAMFKVFSVLTQDLLLYFKKVRKEMWKICLCTNVHFLNILYTFPYQYKKLSI